MIGKTIKVSITQGHLSHDYNAQKRAGTVVSFDAVRIDSDCMSGLAVRIISPWANPVWFDSGWLIKEPTP